MPELLVTSVDPDAVLDLLHALETAQADTVVDARSSDAPGDGSFSTLGSILGAAGFGYLRRGRFFSDSASGDGFDGAVGELVELCGDGNHVVVLVPPDDAGLVGRLATAADQHGCALSRLTPAGVIPHADPLSFD